MSIVDHVRIYISFFIANGIYRSSGVTPAPAPAPAAPAVASLTFRQLEESINKWAVDLDEQEKMFLNQAALVANWDRLLVTNGEKVSHFLIGTFL